MGILREILYRAIPFVKISPEFSPEVEDEAPELGKTGRQVIERRESEEPVMMSDPQDKDLWVMDSASGERKKQQVYLGHISDVTQWMTAVHLRRELLCKPYNDERTCDGNHTDKAGRYVKRVHRCDALIPEVEWTPKSAHQVGGLMGGLRPQPGEVSYYGAITSRICGEEHQRLADHIGNVLAMGKDSQGRILVIQPDIQ